MDPTNLATLIKSLPIGREINTWSQRLAFETALLIENSGRPLVEMLADYQLTKAQFDTLSQKPLFLKEVNDFQNKIQNGELITKIKARILADEFMSHTIPKLIQDVDTPATAKTDLIKTVFAIAELLPDKRSTTNNEGNKEGFTFNIMLGQHNQPNQPPPVNISAGTGSSLERTILEHEQ